MRVRFPYEKIDRITLNILITWYQAVGCAAIDNAIFAIGQAVLLWLAMRHAGRHADMAPSNETEPLLRGSGSVEGNATFTNYSTMVNSTSFEAGTTSFGRPPLSGGSMTRPIIQHGSFTTVFACSSLPPPIPPVHRGALISIPEHVANRHISRKAPGLQAAVVHDHEACIVILIWLPFMVITTAVEPEALARIV
ncbi:hypothetical protein VTN00DRAFT_6140 [Thermoascus crustaceus]|uniref:uncharacterized protein n=1 Tax=Thermoascus crustaceus TaxID=5088 RepID=UPI003742408C